MKRIGWMLLLVGLTACSGGAKDKDQADLQKRVTQLEKKVKALEQVAKGRAKPGEKPSGKAPEKGGAGEKPAVDPATLATVKSEGDAQRVVLTDGKKRFKVPGKVPAGTYKVMAVFEADAKPAEAGEVTLQAKQTTTITCAKADTSCTAGG